MTLAGWLQLLARGKYKVHPRRWGLAATITLFSIFNLKMRLVQTALLGHRIAQTPIPNDPIFILGHWRSGTTFLHELLSADDRFATPNTYQCFAANHFLLTESVLTRLLWFLVPSKRPMDNMAAGWHLPQEDEFALCAMGLPSPYLRMAFPNQQDELLEYLDMRALSNAQRAEWEAGLREFLRRLRLSKERRLILKSPTHTGRIGVLARMFPQAKFIHISRNPYEIVPSTIRLWKSLDEIQGLQIPTFAELEGYIFRAYKQMYSGYEAHHHELDANRLVEIRYEDLIRDAPGTLAGIYQQLQLSDYATLRPKIEKMMAQRANYQRNTHSIDDALVQQINHHWASYFHRYGYEMSGSTGAE